MRLLPTLTGATLGFILVRERLARRAAERVAAGALETLLRAIDANDPETGGHVRRVARYALVLADAAGVSESERSTVERVALFHDVGKIDQALFDITHDDTRLTPAERREIAKHPARGAEVLAPLSHFYPDLAAGVLAHHERWDGTGYPRRLRGRHIPLAARIVTLADTFDAITHARRYRRGRTATEAGEAIAAGRATQFDPELVDLMLFPPVFERFIALHRESLHPAHGPGDRRHGEGEPLVPDVRFRWSNKLPAGMPNGAPASDGA